MALAGGQLNGRIMTACVGAAAATVLFLPALLNGSAFWRCLASSRRFSYAPEPGYRREPSSTSCTRRSGGGPSRRGRSSALARDGDCAAPLRARASDYSSAAGARDSVDVYRHARAARCRQAALQGAADVSAGRRDGRRRAAASHYGQESHMTTGNAFLFLSAFLASAVEMVEALTISLARGGSRAAGARRSPESPPRRSRSPLSTAVLGPASTGDSAQLVSRLVVGGLLLTPGSQWLRKPILPRERLARLCTDEDATPSRASSPTGGRRARRAAGRDWYGFVLFVQGRACLEGLEVVFIVLIRSERAGARSRSPRPGPSPPSSSSQASASRSARRSRGCRRTS